MRLTPVLSYILQSRLVLALEAQGLGRLDKEAGCLFWGTRIFKDLMTDRESNPPTGSKNPARRKATCIKSAQVASEAVGTVSSIRETAALTQQSLV